MTKKRPPIADLKLSPAQERCLRLMWDNREKRGGVEPRPVDRERYGKRMDIRTAGSLCARGLAKGIPTKVPHAWWGPGKFRITPEGRKWVVWNRPAWVAK